MKISVDKQTGEILNSPVVVVEVEQQLSINIDADMIREYHNDPKFIAEFISMQAGRPVFDVSTKKGQKECASFSAKIIKTIAPILEVSKSMAADAKKIVNQDLAFRREIEPMIRHIAAEHRKPLTELEAEQKRIEGEQKARELARFEAEQYMVDWDDALNLNELYDLREAARLKQLINDALESKSEYVGSDMFKAMGLTLEESRVETSFYSEDIEKEPTFYKPAVFSRQSAIQCVSICFNIDYMEAESMLVNEFGNHKGLSDEYL